MDPLPLTTLLSQQAKDQVWVAAPPNGQPVGFAVVQVIDGLAHLAEISVHPAHGRQGLGARLIQALCDWARDRAYPAVTLSTFRDVPWNAPFYERLGFRVLSQEDLGPGLLAVRAEEARHGLDIRERVCMRKDL
jgi:GNAT superfamily N-acetyltransferase